MKTEYKKNINGACLVLEADQVYIEDYQTQMIAANDITGLLQLKAQGINGRSRYYYVVNGMISMKAMFEKSKIRRIDLELFLHQFLEAMRAAYDHMLNINRIILDPEYIFYGEDRFYFCYYPPGSEEINMQFHRLTEYIVRQIDYEDKEIIYMAYELHKKTMDENYSIEHVIHQVLQEREAEEEGETGMEVTLTEVDDMEEAPSPINLKTDGKTSLKKVWLQGKSKWGQWDDLP